MGDLNEQQQRAVEHTGGPILIVAGAGTGKTRVIVEKVQYLLRNVPKLRPENILALTFSNKAAEEMKQRAAQLLPAARGCRFSTFHAFCYQLLSEEAGHTVSAAPPKALDEIDQWIFLRRNLERLELDYYLRVSEPGRFLDDLLEFCSRCHDNLVTPARYSEYVETQAATSLAVPGRNRKPPGQVARRPASKDTMEQEIARQREVARVFARSEELQEAAGVVSFGAMISRAVALLKDSPELLGRLQRRYRFILVDEFQDTNWAQIELLRLLSGAAPNLTVVGDRKQAIYHFRGASHTSFDLFASTFPQSARVVLNENYRSTKRILAVAEAVIARAREQYKADEPLRTANPKGSKVAVCEFADDAGQAEWVALEIGRRMAAGEARAYSDFAVLYRAHRYRNRLVRALRRHGIPFAIRKLAINQLPAVRDMLACLRAIGDRRDSISLLRVMAGPKWEMGTNRLRELCRAASGRRLALAEVAEEQIAQANGDAPLLRNVMEFLDRYRKIAQEQRLGTWIGLLRQELRLFERPEEAPAWKAFSDFIHCWDLEKSSTGLLREFLEYFAYFEEANGSITLPDEDAGVRPGQPGPGTPGTGNPSTQPVQGSLWNRQPPNDALGKVQLMTVHAAKGLEFENVFLLHLLRGAFPSRHRRPLISFPTALLRGPAPEGDLHLEEERRLFYVALTRARSMLTLCTVSNAKQRPSVFLQELQDSNCPDLAWSNAGPPAVAPTPEPEPCPPRAIHAGRIGGDAAARHGGPVLSVSAIEMYLECPLKYAYSHLWQVPVAPAAALRFGSIMHGAVRQVVSTAQHRETAPAADIEAILREHWDGAGFSEPVQAKKYWEMGLEQLQGVWNDFSATPFELLAQEQTFQFVRGETRVVGRIDQISRNAAQQIELIEYKTGRPQTQKDADRSLQLTIYAQACREVLHLDGVSLMLYNLATRERLRTKRNREDFQMLEETLQEVSANVAAARFPPVPGYRCRYCDFRSICPSHEDCD